MATKKATDVKAEEKAPAVSKTEEKPVEKKAAPAKAASAAKPAEKKAPAAKKAAPAKKTANESKAPAKKAASKKAAAEVIIQSELGGEITPESILAKVGDVDKVYVRVDQNKAFWVRGEETGSVDLW